MKSRVYVRLLSSKLWLPILVGGVALQFSGCDPTVRDTVLTGIQTSLVGLVTALLNGFFLALQNGATGGSTSQPVVQATFEALTRWLA